MARAWQHSLQALFFARLYPGKFLQYGLVAGGEPRRISRHMPTASAEGARGHFEGYLTDAVSLKTFWNATRPLGSYFAFAGHLGACRRRTPRGVCRCWEPRGVCRCWEVSQRRVPSSPVPMGRPSASRSNPSVLAVGMLRKKKDPRLGRSLGERQRDAALWHGRVRRQHVRRRHERRKARQCRAPH